MLKIAHRGNTNGTSIHENQLWYIQKAIDSGYDAEIDVWSINDRLWAGHDSAQYLIDETFLQSNKDKLWIHCKNFEALSYFSSKGFFYNYFWHQTDDYTVTSHGFVWTYPGKQVGEWSIIVDLENKTEYNCYGICSDNFA